MAKTRVGVIGTGAVGTVLSDGLLSHGYAVMRGTREPAKLEAWKRAAGADASVGSFAEAAKYGERIVLAVKGAAAESAVDLCGAENLANKTVIDTTNPIAEAPPVHGVLHYFTSLEDSLMERLQRRAPDAKFVKAFSCVGSALMVSPTLPGGPPTMFICGNDSGAKREVTEILARFGWEVEDMGHAEAARAIEPLCILWCVPGFLTNQWTHALKLLRK